MTSPFAQSLRMFMIVRFDDTALVEGWPYLPNAMRDKDVGCIAFSIDFFGKIPLINSLPVVFTRWRKALAI